MHTTSIIYCYALQAFLDLYFLARPLLPLNYRPYDPFCPAPSLSELPTPFPSALSLSSFSDAFVQVADLRGPATKIIDTPLLHIPRSMLLDLKSNVR
jgi:hypothetical protein